MLNHLTAFLKLKAIFNLALRLFHTCSQTLSHSSPMCLRSSLSIKYLTCQTRLKPMRSATQKHTLKCFCMHRFDNNIVLVIKLLCSYIIHGVYTVVTEYVAWHFPLYIHRIQPPGVANCCVHRSCTEHDVCYTYL